jgi:hypothetical protein
MSVDGYRFGSQLTDGSEDPAIESLVCALDPDGSPVEVIEFLPRGAELYFLLAEAS